MLVTGVSALTNRRRVVVARDALAQEQALRGEAETAFLQAVEEIRRLRIDVKTGGDLHQHLNVALQESSHEAVLLRSKAEALANTLQRVMPYETESGLLNPEKFTRVLRREAARMQRQEQPLTLVLAKLDYFGDFEQTYGRVPYEAVVRRIADVMHKAGNRPGDVAARLNDDTFALLFPEAETHHGLKLAETVRTRLLQLGIRNSRSPAGVVSASLGTATILPNSETTDAVLREHAEAALYEASFQGGNRCVRYRVAQSIKVEHWDSQNEGALTLASLRHKLAILGYEGKPRRLKPGETGRERRVALDSVEAVIEGTLRVTFDGEARTLRPGDFLYMPKGTVVREEVGGADPVLCIEGTRA
jgi:diguanylate cyclase (GGDEF)-like protein